MAEVAPAPAAPEPASASSPKPTSTDIPSPPPTTAPAAESAPDATGEDSEMTDGTKPEAAEDDKDKEDPLPEGATEVLYVNNLNEKIKLDIMKQSLKVLFKEYGSVLGVTAHRNLRMRGQAFVTLDTKQAAAKAVKEVQQFPLYGKPMQLSFARTESDALVKKRHPDDMDSHKQERLKRKKESRRTNPIRQKLLAKQEASRKAHETALITGVPAAPVAAPARRIVQIPDEYLPPNKILFVQNLPDDTTKESLETLFKPYPNLIEVRTIPGRRNIAFVEFVDEASSGVAREALHNTKLGGDDGVKLKVTNAKK